MKISFQTDDGRFMECETNVIPRIGETVRLYVGYSPKNYVVKEVEYNFCSDATLPYVSLLVDGK